MGLWSKAAGIPRCIQFHAMKENWKWLRRAPIRLYSVSSVDDGDDGMDSSSSKALPDASGIDPDCSTKASEFVTKMRFDTLGPAVVTETGKVRFFEDWEGKTEQEKEDILKIIIPRNKQRLQRLQDQEIDSTVNAAMEDLKQRELEAHKALLRAQAEAEEADSKIDWSKDDHNDR